MHALVLFAHADPDSLTGSVARRLCAGLEQAGWSTELADLGAEGFDPRMTAADHDVLKGVAGPPADVLREQERVERADALVIVHPVYWWAMPALLKGWFDRVLTFGWAFGTETATALAGRDIHIVRLGGNSPATYDNHGYREAIRTGVEHGIFEFAGSPAVSSHLLHTAPEGVAERADETLDAILASVTGARTPVLS
jgi:NAD(P)H dehydrogenase (quinone)